MLTATSRARRARSAISAVLAALLLLQTSGCAGWMPLDTAAHPLSAGTNRKVLVRRWGGWRLEADSARSVGGSLLIFRGAAVDTIPLNEVNEVEVRGIDWWKTVLVFGGTLGGLIVISLIACADGGCE